MFAIKLLLLYWCCTYYNVIATKNETKEPTPHPICIRKGKNVIQFGTNEEYECYKKCGPIKGEKIDNGKGAIPKDCIVPCNLDGEANEICASNGISYPNKCIFNAARTADYRIQWIHKGPCPKPSNQISDKILKYWPVCDDNGVIYYNPKTFETMNPGKHWNRYPDMCEVSCEISSGPVCGTNGVTYKNVCELSKQRRIFVNLEVAHDGACKPDCTC